MQVQDMMDPEYYVGAYRQQHGLWQTRKYSDAPAGAICEDTETVIWTRKPLYCCKLQGEAEWCTPSTSSIQHQGVCKPSGLRMKTRGPIFYEHILKEAEGFIGRSAQMESAALILEVPLSKMSVQDFRIVMIDMFISEIVVSQRVSDAGAEKAMPPLED